MKKVHIVITENKEGRTKTILETDATGIIGAINQGQGAVAAVSLTNGELPTILETLHAMGEVKKRMYADHPELKLAELLIGVKTDKVEEVNVDEDTDETVPEKDEPSDSCGVFEEPEPIIEETVPAKDEPAKKSKCNFKNLFKKGDK